MKDAGTREDESITLTIEFSANEEKLITEAATRRGVILGDFVRTACRELAALDAAEDAADARLGRAAVNPAQRRTLDQLREALQGR